MSQDFVRIIIEGETASSVQGAELRDDVQKEAEKIKIKGRIRNTKGKSEVEIICEADKASSLYEKINELKSRGDKGEKLYKIKNVKPPDKDVFNFDGFDVMREDDLSEMVWALQGAGKAFKFLGEQTEKLEKNKQKMKMKSLITGLESELASISDRTGLLKSKEKSSNFHLFAIENFLKEPPVDDLDLIRNLRDLYDICQDTNNLVYDHEGFRNNLQKIENIINELSKKLESLKLLYTGINK